MTCILQQRWPAKEIRQWVAMLQGKQQAMACAIRGAKTARPLWIAPGSITDRANPGATERLNPTYKPALHQVVTDYSQDSNYKY